MKKKKVIIIGAGKLSKSIVAGLLFAGIDPRDILVIGRAVDSFDYYIEHGVACASEFQHRLGAEFLILAVTPPGAGAVLSDLHMYGVKYETLISFVSGLFPDTISRVLEIPLTSIAIATANTNIGSGNGVVCVLATENKHALLLLEKLGTVSSEPSEEMLIAAIMSVGSMNAFDAQAIKMAYDIYATNSSLYDWLCGLANVLNCETAQSDSYQLFMRYLDAKSRALANIYTQSDACERARATTVSTLNALISKGSAVTVSDIEILIQSVVTKGGCTEKGMHMMNSVDMLHDVEKLREVFTLVYNRARAFPADVENSFN